MTDSSTIVKSGETTLTPPSPTSPPHTVSGLQEDAINPMTLDPNDILDIEHAVVINDPRLWSRTQKNIILAIIAFAAIAPTLAVSIYNPAFAQIERELHASTQEISLSLSLFILFQGTMPLVWSAISEIQGRKRVYLLSMTIFVVSAAIGGSSHRMPLLIVMRILQASGAAAVLTLGAGTLADIYESRERGTMMGIYYATPLLGPAIGPIIGGVLTDLFNWRATFYFLDIFGGISLITFIFLRDTFRPQRSAAYQSAKERLITRRAAKKALKEKDIEAGTAVPIATEPEQLKLTLADVNFSGTWHVLKRRSNLVILTPSGCLFAFQYGICYTIARTFAAEPYHYSPIKIGLVLLSFGVGNMSGSILGGRWSDHVLQRLKIANGGRSTPEMRLRSTIVGMIILPPSVLAYAWLAAEKVNVAAPVVFLFISGFTVMWIYASTLAYIVDANPGRSSTAIATNSAFRGISGLIAAEISPPLQDAIGDGGLYTLWAGALVVVVLLMCLVMLKGAAWRDQEDQKERQRETEKVEKEEKGGGKLDAERKLEEPDQKEMIPA